MPMTVHQFVCLSDNYGVLVHDPETKATASIDAPEGAPVLAALTERGWELTHILLTHHHADHIQGVPALKAKFPKAVVVGPAKERERIRGMDRLVKEGDRVEIGSLSARVFETPGHTLGHIVYDFDKDKICFAGDTMFSLGCGRVFEAPYPTMWESLQKLAKLPPETQFYCGHEYTEANGRFAATIEPDNAALKARIAEVGRLRAAGQPTLPTTLAEELKTNPFLRAAESSVQTSVGMKGADPAAVFTEIRQRKDRS